MPVIKLANVPEIQVGDRGGDSLVMKKAVGSKKRDPKFVLEHDTDGLSITHIRHWGRHRRMTCFESDRVMFLIEGEADVQVGVEPKIRAGAGDFVLIPKGTPYEFGGDFTYLVINGPAYREGSDVRDDAGSR
jgi:ethanolamine utilization protein EutQ (cupin superfamily)